MLSSAVLGKRIRKPSTLFDDSYKRPDSNPNAPCKQGDSVLVKDKNSGILWEARVMNAKELTSLGGKQLYYKVVGVATTMTGSAAPWWRVAVVVIIMALGSAKRIRRGSNTAETSTSKPK